MLNSCVLVSFSGVFNGCTSSSCPFVVGCCNCMSGDFSSILVSYSRAFNSFSYNSKHQSSKVGEAANVKTHRVATSFEFFQLLFIHHFSVTFRSFQELSTVAVAAAPRWSDEIESGAAEIALQDPQQSRALWSVGALWRPQLAPRRRAEQRRCDAASSHVKYFCQAID